MLNSESGTCLVVHNMIFTFPPVQNSRCSRDIVNSQLAIITCNANKVYLFITVGKLEGIHMSKGSNYLHLFQAV